MVHCAVFLPLARHASLRSTTPTLLSSLSRVSPYASLLKPRFYATQRRGATHRHVQSKSKSIAKEQTSAPSAAVPTPRHEAHEGSLTMSVPMNPPGGGGGPGPGGSGSTFPITNSPLMDAILTTSIGLVLVFIGGVVYIKWYKANVLDKIEKAFEAGYDPALDLARNHSAHAATSASQGDSDVNYSLDDTPWTEAVRRTEQETIDNIIHGKETGHYYLLLGPKGSGKGTMIFDAMAEINAEHVSLCDAHPDLEVFRLRLGKALNYEYNEDTQTGLFQRRDPREGGPALDIERALNKLEKVALRMHRRTGRPLVLIINNVHYLHNDEDGKNMLLQLQQKAEAWAASGVLTMVFSSDDFWPFQILRKTGSRMQVISVYDLNSKDALQAAKRMREHSTRPAIPDETLEKAVHVVGGRLSYLSKVAKSSNPVETADKLLSVEKSWLLSQIGLIPDCDDDVMDEQKWSSCSWLLLQEFVKIREEQEKERQEKIEAGLIDAESAEELPLPSIPYWRCRQIMTRTDFMEELDRINVISIDIDHEVRPDSTLVLYAAQDVVNEEDFQEILDGVRDRIDEIESLHRTRELTFKDLDKGDMVRFSLDKRGAEILETLRGKSDD